MIGLNFRLLITAMDPDELEWYMALKDLSPMHRYSNWNLSSHQGHISRWCKGHDCSRPRAFWRSTSSKSKMVWENPWKTPDIAVLQRLAKFQALCSLQFHALNIPPQQTWKAHAAPPVSSKLPVPMPAVPPPPQAFRGGSIRLHWGKSNGSATNLEILHPRNMAQEKTVAPKRACGRFWWKRKNKGIEMGLAAGKNGDNADNLASALACGSPAMDADEASCAEASDSPPAPPRYPCPCSSRGSCAPAHCATDAILLCC